MTNVEYLLAIENLLSVHKRTLAVDLSQCQNQKTVTSKHQRRERTLSYLVEMLTGSFSFRPSETEAVALVCLIEETLSNTHEQEARIGLERAEKRLRYMLSNPELLRRGLHTCVACGEEYAGFNHECTNLSARTKDRVMTHDETVKEID